MDLNLFLVRVFWSNETSGLEPFFVEEKLTFWVILTVFETPLPNIHLPLVLCLFFYRVCVLCTGLDLKGGCVSLKRAYLRHLKNSRFYEGNVNSLF